MLCYIVPSDYANLLVMLIIVVSISQKPRQSSTLGNEPSKSIYYWKGRSNWRYSIN